MGRGIRDGSEAVELAEVVVVLVLLVMSVVIGH